jgi:protein-tyrosine phosphatase
MKRVLFVCLGNICRSPLAEGLFKETIEERNLGHKFEVDSCGTNGLHDGESPDIRTRNNARKHGLQLHHQSRQITPGDFEYFDHIYVMDENNLRTVRGLCPAEYQFKIEKIRNFDSIQTGSDVEDPWYGGDEGFETTYQTLLRCTRSLADELLTNRG